MIAQLHQASVVEKGDIKERDRNPMDKINLEHLASHVYPDELEQLKGWFQSWEDIFSRNANDIGKTNVVKHRIDLVDETPIKERARRIPPNMLNELGEHIQKLLQTGVIEESSSPWSSPIVIVRKKNGELRLCVDYFRLNSQTKMDSYAIPAIDQLLDRLGEASWFTSLDLTVR